MLLVGLVLFALASAAGGVAATIPLLAASRAVQGIAAALVAPAALPILTTASARGPNNRAGLPLLDAVDFVVVPSGASRIELLQEAEADVTSLSSPWRRTDRPRLSASYTQYNTAYATTETTPVSVRHALLALLSEGPTYGLRLRQEFEARTGEAWPLNVGQVYSTLQRLERDGYVEVADLGDSTQKAYAITGDGRRELDQWLTTPPDDAPPRDELVMKVLIAQRLPGVDLPGLLQAHRHHLLITMRTFTRAKEDAAEDDLALLLVADAEIYRLDAAVRWLDTAEARLRRDTTPQNTMPRAPALPAGTPVPEARPVRHKAVRP